MRYRCSTVAGKVIKTHFQMAPFSRLLHSPGALLPLKATAFFRHSDFLPWVVVSTIRLSSVCGLLLPLHLLHIKGVAQTFHLSLSLSLSISLKVVLPIRSDKENPSRKKIH